MKGDKGIGQLIKQTDVLQPRFWKVNGLINEITNRVLFERLVAGWSFPYRCTKPKERPKRGDKGVGPPDEAAE